MSKNPNKLIEDLKKISKSGPKRISLMPRDYFSWGRDVRELKNNNKPDLKPDLLDIKKAIKRFYSSLKFRLENIDFMTSYASFNESYSLMSDDYSRNLFCELIAMQKLGEDRFRLSSFTQIDIMAYENAYAELKNAKKIESMGFTVKKTKIPKTDLTIYCVPQVLSLYNTNRLYSYKKNEVQIKAKPMDVVIAAGIGFGCTTMLTAAAVTNGGMVYGFDIQQESFDMLEKQKKLNPSYKNIIGEFMALSDKDDEEVYLDNFGPGAYITKEKTEKSVKTITIDSYITLKKIKKVDFIKMDIEGSEIPALQGATDTIKLYKPRLVISAYHKWDDLREIPRTIKEIRDDYKFYIDCTTGFGGETILYCE